MKFPFRGCLAMLPRIVAIVTICVIATAGQAQNLFVPTIPEAVHRDYLRQLRLEGSESGLADAAYESYAADKENADRVHSVRNRWVVGLRLEKNHANDPELTNQLADGLLRFDKAWYEAVARIESAYFDALGVLAPGRERVLLHIKRSWKRSWLLNTTEIPRDAPPGAVMDVARILEETPHTDSAELLALIEAYEADMDAMLSKLLESFLAKDVASTWSQQLYAAAKAGDWTAAKRIAADHIALVHRSRRVLHQMRVANVEYASQVNAILPWRESVEFRSRTRPVLFAYLFSTAADAPERQTATALRTHPNAAPDQLEGLQAIDRQYDRQFQAAIGMLEPAYRKSISPEAAEARIVQDMLHQLGNTDEPKIEPGDPAEFDAQRRKFQAACRESIRQAQEYARGLP